MPPHIVKAIDAEIEKLNTDIQAMASACREQLVLAIQAFRHLDTLLAQTVVKGDAQINRQQIQIEKNCVTLLAKRHPVAADLRHLLSVMKIATELERIGDYAANIAKRVMALSGTPSREPVELIIEMADICGSMIQDAMDAFFKFNIETAVAVWQRDGDIDRKFARMMTLVRKQMQEDTGAVENNTQLIFMGRCCERIGDHITNIAEDIYYMATGENYMDML